MKWWWISVLTCEHCFLLRMVSIEFVPESVQISSQGSLHTRGIYVIAFCCWMMYFLSNVCVFDFWTTYYFKSRKIKRYICVLDVCYSIVLDVANLLVATFVNFWRQKQYFEQRKRQQQQQQTAESESYGDGTSTCSQHQNEQRSLDVLSLLNWSTVSQECRSACPSGEYIIIF